MDATNARAEVFPVGPPVTPEHQVGRLGDIERVAEALRGGDHIVLSDVRRAGKSTVALGALDLLGDDEPTPVIIALDLHERISSSQQLATEIARQVALQRSRTAVAGFRIRRLAFRLWDRTRDISIPGVTDQEDALIAKGIVELISPDRDDVGNVAAALQGVERLAADRATHAFVFIDEAQELAGWPDAIPLQSELKTRLRTVGRRTTFLFAGSHPSMMARMFAQGGLLEYDGQHLKLSPLLEDLARDDLRRSFRELELDVASRALDNFLIAAEGRPVRLMIAANKASRLAVETGQTLIDAALAAQAIAEARDDRFWNQGGPSR